MLAASRKIQYVDFALNGEAQNTRHVTARQPKHTDIFSMSVFQPLAHTVCCIVQNPWHTIKQKCPKDV